MLQETDINTFLFNKGFEARERKIPVGITFELTPRCNLKCRMCYIRIEDADVPRYGKELTAEEWIGLGRQAVEEGAITVQLTGGEIFLRKDFFEIYEALSDMGLRIYLSTNGTLITKEIAERVAKRPPLSVTITLYGASAETYKRLCGNPSGYERTIRGIENLIAVGITPKITFTLTKENKGDAASVKRIMKSYGLDFIGTNRLFSQREDACGNNSSMQVDAREMNEVTMALTDADCDGAMLENLRKKIDYCERLKTSSACSRTNRKGFLCAAGKAHFWINWRGEMGPCGMEKEIAAYPLNTSVHQAWESIVHECENKVAVPEKCMTCEARPFCIVCQTAFKDKTGSYDIPPQEHCRLSFLELMNAKQFLKIEQEKRR